MNFTNQLLFRLEPFAVGYPNMFILCKQSLLKIRKLKNIFKPSFVFQEDPSGLCDVKYVVSNNEVKKVKDVASCETSEASFSSLSQVGVIITVSS